MQIMPESIEKRAHHTINQEMRLAITIQKYDQYHMSLVNVENKMPMKANIFKTAISAQAGGKIMALVGPFEAVASVSGRQKRHMALGGSTGSFGNGISSRRSIESKYRRRRVKRNQCSPVKYQCRRNRK